VQRPRRDYAGDVNLPQDLEPWHAWLSLAVVLGVLELLSLDLVLLMVAAGALVGAGADLVGLPVWAQLLAAATASVAALGLVRPSVVKRLREGPTLQVGHESMIGTQAVVVEEVSWKGGLVRVNGELWSARPYEEGLVIEPGRRVDIFQIKGATALVHQAPELE
jgi:membrane protein implicated in regulation of membrane protease activity